MNKGAVIAGIIGLGAVGLGAYALSRNSNSQKQTSSNDAFNGFTGGGSTGGPLGEALSSALNNAFVTPTSQIEPYSEIIPEMLARDNPSDEVSDVNQVLRNLRTLNSTPGFDPSKTELYLSGVQKDQNTSQKTTAAEYNQGNSFAPTPKQADMSSYNEQKTGGNTENTPKQTSSDKKTSTKTASNNQFTVGDVVNAAGDAIGRFTGWW